MALFENKKNDELAQELEQAKTELEKLRNEKVALENKTKATEFAKALGQTNWLYKEDKSYTENLEDLLSSVTEYVNNVQNSFKATSSEPVNENIENTEEKVYTNIMDAVAEIKKQNPELSNYDAIKLAKEKFNIKEEEA